MNNDKKDVQELEIIILNEKEDKEKQDSEEIFKLSKK